MERQPCEKAHHPHIHPAPRWSLTPRALGLGFLFGSLFSLTNLYVSAKAGVTFGMGLTASILSYAIFRLVAKARSIREFNVWENIVVQTVAGAGGYMASAFTASLAAVMVVDSQVLPWWQAACWCGTLSCLGLVLAIPHKRRFVNDLSYPFPEGQACGVVLATLHRAPLIAPQSDSQVPPTPTRSEPGDSSFVEPRKTAKILLFSAVAAGMLKLLQSATILGKLHVSQLQVPEMLDVWYYRLAARLNWPVLQINGISLRELTIRPSLDLAMLAVGGMMGIRLSTSLLVGAVINYFVLAPWMVARGDIATSLGDDHIHHVGFRAICSWSLWPGVAMMTAASLVAYIVHSWKLPNTIWMSRWRRPATERDDVTGSEMPLSWFWLGVLILGSAVMIMSSLFFHVSPLLVMMFLPIVMLLPALGIHATALTSITPTGAMARVSQLIAGLIAPHQSTANLILGSITAETTMHASTFCQHLRPGFMLRVNPRTQAVGHVVGTIAGVVSCVPAFYFLFLRDDPRMLISDAYPFPAASVWIGVTQMLTVGWGGLATSALMVAGLGALLGLLLSLPIARVSWMNLSPVGMSLAFLIPFHASLAIFSGGFIFWCIDRINSAQRAGNVMAPNTNREAICAGAMTGTALVGIADLAIESIWP